MRGKVQPGFCLVEVCTVMELYGHVESCFAEVMFR